MDSVTFNFLIRSIQLRPSWRLRESKFVYPTHSTKICQNPTCER